MLLRPTVIAVSGVVLVLLAGCTSGDEEGASAATTASSSAIPTGPPAVLAGNLHMDGAVRLLAEQGTGPDRFQLPDTSGFPSLILTITCPSDDTTTGLTLEYATGTGEKSMGSDGCNGASYETPPLDPANLPTAVRVAVPEGAGYTVYVYGTQQEQVIG